ncbi:MAG: hypothetical protein MRY74_11885 [Neomegalonema sp.]|nr:hypothetical protein [Neomegalonema sp.]
MGRAGRARRGTRQGQGAGRFPGGHKSLLIGEELGRIAIEIDLAVLILVQRRCASSGAGAIISGADRLFGDCADGGAIVAPFMCGAHPDIV